jgi:hypothetical protein
MRKGSVAAASMSKPVEGKRDTSKPAGGEVKFGFTAAARKGKPVKVQK